MFDDSNVKNEIAAITEIFNTDYKLLGLGFTDDPEGDIAKLKEKMTAAGADTVYAGLTKIEFPETRRAGRRFRPLCCCPEDTLHALFMLVAPLPRRNTVNSLKRPGKMELVLIAYRRSHIRDGEGGQL